MFTRPLDPERLAAAGIVLPRGRVRMGRGGRILVDRWDPLTQTPLGWDRPPFSTESLQPPPPRL